MDNNTFYFSLSMFFDTDYDVSKMEKILGIKATELVPLAKSLGPNKCAKFLYYTQKFTGVPSEELFEKFVDKIYQKAPNLKSELDANKGELSICIVFTEFVTKPCLYVSNETLTKLAKLGADYEVDIFM